MGKYVLAVAVSASLLSGCASIVGGTSQIVTVDASNKGEQVKGAVCELENSKGKFYVTSPGTVTINRTYSDLVVKCNKEDLATGTTSAKSCVNGWMFGNILFGGVIGVAIDAGSGAGFTYPETINVIMGQEVAQQQEQPDSPSES